MDRVEMLRLRSKHKITALEILHENQLLEKITPVIWLKIKFYWIFKKLKMQKAVI